MEAILELASIPCPGLGPALSLAKEIWVLVQDIEIGRKQLETLAICATQLLSSLHPLLLSGKLREDIAADTLEDLNDLLDQILVFIRKQRKIGFLKLMIINDDRKAAIENFHKRISACVSAFSIASLINVQYWQTEHEKARKEDRRALNETLRRLQANSTALDEILATSQKSAVAVMATLEKIIEKGHNDPEELKFFTKSLKHLQNTSQQHADVHPWTVTSIEVEFGPLIGVGGFGKVYRGTWNQMEVALKVMKNPEDLKPQASTIKREVEAWSSLRHPHILQFLGANVLDDIPFIVMPFVHNGHAKSFLSEHPDTDRTKLAYQISLGLAYLHNVPIVHGDLKAVNVLIGEGGQALLSDFGLARMKHDMLSRSTKADTNTVLGSQNWMAPELFDGGTLRRPCDIYSFAMTLYEIFTLEIPLGNVSPSRLPDVVTRLNRRPERPDSEEAEQLTDIVWRIIEECWVAQSTERPLASAIVDRLSALIKTSDLTPQQTTRKNSTSIAYAPPSPARSRSDSNTSIPTRTLSLSPRSPLLQLPGGSGPSSVHGRPESLRSIPEMQLPPMMSAEPELASIFVRPGPARYHHWIGPRHHYEPEAGRYRLYVSYACPWSMEALIARSLKRLDSIVSISVLSPIVDDLGWSFPSSEDTAEGPSPQHTRRLRDYYLRDNPQYDGIFSLPILWDKKTNTIVNNDALEIVRMFGTVFNDMIPSRSTRSLDFFPAEAQAQSRVGKWRDHIDFAAAAIYKAGYAASQSEYDAAVTEVFSVLDKVESQLRNTQCLVGNKLTIADLRLWTFLVPFDAVYTSFFKCNTKSIRADYPKIHDYLRNLYWGIPAFKAATHFDHIKTHYYLSHQRLNHMPVVPSGPAHFILPQDSRHNPEKLLSQVCL